MELQVLAPFEEILRADVVKVLAESQSGYFALLPASCRSGEHPGPRDSFI